MSFFFIDFQFKSGPPLPLPSIVYSDDMGEAVSIDQVTYVSERTLFFPIEILRLHRQPRYQLSGAFKLACHVGELPARCVRGVS
jgi:hypothetical protein